MGAMREVTYRECELILNYNGFFVDHQSGSHVIFKNERGKHISIRINNVNACLWRRLVKENSLDEKYNKKRRKTW